VPRRVREEHRKANAKPGQLIMKKLRKGRK